MLVTPNGLCNRRSLQGGSAIRRIIHLMLASSRVDYFFWLNDRIAIIKLAKAHANINASNTVTAPPPFIWGCCLPTLEIPIQLLFYYIINNRTYDLKVIKNYESSLNLIYMFLYIHRQAIFFILLPSIINS